MDIKSHKLWDIIGAAIGGVAILAGLALFVAAPEHYSTHSSDGHASFGADFYTYIYSAADAAAVNTAVTANNLREMGETQAKQVGACLMLLGALVVVHYGKSYFCTPEPAQTAAEPVAAAPTGDAPAPEEAADPNAEAPGAPPEESTDSALV